MIGEADETMQLLQKTLIASNDILGDPKLREQIKQTIAEMPAVLKETRGAVERVERHLRLAGAEHAEHRGPDQAAGRARAGPRRRVRREHEEAQPVERQHAAIQPGVERPAGFAGGLVARQGALSARQSHGEELRRVEPRPEADPQQRARSSPTRSPGIPSRSASAGRSRRTRAEGQSFQRRFRMRTSPRQPLADRRQRAVWKRSAGGNRVNWMQISTAVLRHAGRR